MRGRVGHLVAYRVMSSACTTVRSPQWWADTADVRVARTLAANCIYVCALIFSMCA